MAAEAAAVAEAAAPEARFDAPPVIEALRALDGWCALSERDGTLDGSLPLRVVQGCEPMLDGTAFGVQVSQLSPLRVTRRWGRWRVEALPFSRQIERWGIDGEGPPGASSLERFEVQRRAALPAMVARGMLSPEDAADLPLARVVSRRGAAHLRLWTGYFVRVGPAQRLVSLRASPRRTLGLDLTPSTLAAHQRWVPLVLELSLDPAAREIVVEGEIAALGVFPEVVELRECGLGDAPELARRLLDFYDPEYFEAKRRGEVTRKYRRLPRPEAVAARPWMRIAHGGLSELRGASVEGPGGAVGCVELRCAMELSVRFDGQRVRLEADEVALRERREAVQGAWAPWASPDEPTTRGALLYLTRYMTPHPFGEPHFFVKPCDLVQTPPGWFTLVEGVGVPGVGEVLRGAVRTDVFHATPAVFSLPTCAEAGRVRRGALLARLFAAPRPWLSPIVNERPWTLEAPLEARRGS